MQHDKPTALFLVGPTATGKTEVAVLAADRLNAEIISADSMQIYRGMDIGTAKPSVAQRRQAPHHLMDIVSPHEPFDTAQFAQCARQCILEITARGRIPLVVGGTPLYLKALAEGLFSGPRASPEIRRRLDAEYESAGPEAMHERLVTVDPISAGKLHPNDRKRIIRALEVHELTGKPISALQTQFGRPTTWMRALFVGLRRLREEIYRRIDARVEEMFREGLVPEVECIRATGGFGPQSSQALGYREILDALEQGTPLEQAKVLIQRNTRHMARKQLTWFRHMPYVRWVDVGARSPTVLADKVVSVFGEMLDAGGARDR